MIEKQNDKDSMKTEGDSAQRVGARERERVWFGVCVAFGFVASFGLLVAGTFALVPVGIAAALLFRRRAFRSSAFGLPVGVGLLSLFVAYLQRRGPGTICWHTASAAGCDQYADPKPWLLAGLAFVALGLVGYVLRHRGRVRAQALS